ncbi:MAG: hypothetical protein RJB42_48 [Bacteroidota bacterium]|jgi:hypothetical protein
MNKLAKMFAWGTISLLIPFSPSFAMDEERPDEHLCTITLTVMQDPIVAADGHSDEIIPSIGVDIPAIALGHEDIYKMFINGRLIYNGREVAKIENIINRDTLEGTFDLSGCGHATDYFSIHVGYRKEKKAENRDKMEIWFVPKFLVERDLETTARHFIPIMHEWSSPIAIFWTFGEWNLRKYDYLCTQPPELFNGDLYGDLYEKYCAAQCGRGSGNSVVTYRTLDNVEMERFKLFLMPSEIKNTCSQRPATFGL